MEFKFQQIKNSLDWLWVLSSFNNWALNDYLGNLVCMSGWGSSSSCLFSVMNQLYDKGIWQVSQDTFIGHCKLFESIWQYNKLNLNPRTAKPFLLTKQSRGRQSDPSSPSHDFLNGCIYKIKLWHGSHGSSFWLANFIFHNDNQVFIKNIMLWQLSFHNCRFFIKFFICITNSA